MHSWVSSSGEILLGPEFYPSPGGDRSGVARFIPHVHSPADDDQSMAYFYLLSILAARERVYLATPYFIPDEPLKAALMRHARAGVDVRFLGDLTRSEELTLETWRQRGLWPRLRSLISRAVDRQS